MADRGFLSVASAFDIGWGASSAVAGLVRAPSERIKLEQLRRRLNQHYQAIDADTAVRVIAPVLCKTEQQQRDFTKAYYDEFEEQLRKLREPQIHQIGGGRVTTVPIKPSDKMKAFADEHWNLCLLAFLALALALGAIIATQCNRADEAVATSVIGGQGAPTTTPDDPAESEEGAFEEGGATEGEEESPTQGSSEDPTKTENGGTEAAEDAEESVPSFSRVSSDEPDIFILWIVLFFVACFAAYAIAHLLRNRQLRRPTSRQIADELELEFQNSIGCILESPSYRQAIHKLGFHRAVESQSINVRKSISATMAQGGFPSIVYGHKPARPSFLFLSERESSNDLLAEICNVFAQRMDEESVAVDHYEFFGDPRRLFREDSSGNHRQQGLNTTLSAHQDSNVLLMMESHDCFESEGNRNWLDRIQESDRPVFMNPKSEANWGEYEQDLQSRNFTMLAFGLEGIESLSDRLASIEGTVSIKQDDIPDWDLPEGLASEKRYLLNDEPPDRGVIELLVFEIDNWLTEPEAFWFKALAIFPYVHPGMVLHLGRSLKWADENEKSYALYSDERLVKLARLPWIRAGRIPNWLREALVRTLPQSQFDAAMDAVSAFLKLPIRGQASSPIKIARERKALAKWLRTAPENILHDRLLLDALNGVSIDKLAVDAPQTLMTRARKLFANDLILASLITLLLAGGALSVLHFGYDRFWVKQLQVDLGQGPGLVAPDAFEVADLAERMLDEGRALESSETSASNETRNEALLEETNALLPYVQDRVTKPLGSDTSAIERGQWEKAAEDLSKLLSLLSSYRVPEAGIEAPAGVDDPDDIAKDSVTDDPPPRPPIPRPDPDPDPVIDAGLCRVSLPIGVTSRRVPQSTVGMTLTDNLELRFPLDESADLGDEYKAAINTWIDSLAAESIDEVRISSSAWCEVEQSSINSQSYWLQSDFDRARRQNRRVADYLLSSDRLRPFQIDDQFIRNPSRQPLGDGLGGRVGLSATSLDDPLQSVVELAPAPGFALVPSSQERYEFPNGRTERVFPTVSEKHLQKLISAFQRYGDDGEVQLRILSIAFDPQRTAGSSKDISYARADSVRDYLVEAGVDPAKIRTLIASNPANLDRPDNSSESLRRNNYVTVGLWVSNGQQNQLLQTLEQQFRTGIEQPQQQPPQQQQQQQQQQQATGAETSEADVPSRAIQVLWCRAGPSNQSNALRVIDSLNGLVGRELGGFRISEVDGPTSVSRAGESTYSPGRLETSYNEVRFDADEEPLADALIRELGETIPLTKHQPNSRQTQSAYSISIFICDKGLPAEAQ
ncbi:MAG: hypothetical protein AAGH57_06710 [Pseudomonadota bacterium]